MRKTLLGMAALAALGTASAGQATTISFGSNAGDIGSWTKTYTNGSYSVTAYGCQGVVGLTCTTPVNLYEKNQGGDEVGIGLANDPQGQGEIWNNQSGLINAIVLDLAGLGGANASAVLGSVTDGEDFNILGWTGSSWVNVLTGNADGTYALTGGYRYYQFTTDGTITPGQPNSFGNILLDAIVVPDVPEPSTWAMMLLGFGGIGFAMRRRPASKIAQVA